jgi:hypothetical protein
MLKAAGNSELLTRTDNNFAFCEETSKADWKSVKQNHISRSTTEAEFYALLEKITEVEFLQDAIHFAYKFQKLIFNFKNNPTSVIIQVQERLPAQSNPAHEQSLRITTGVVSAPGEDRTFGDRIAFRMTLSEK